MVQMEHKIEYKCFKRSNLKKNTLFQTAIFQALYGFYGDREDSEKYTILLENLPKNEKTIAALVKFILNENEDEFVRSTATKILINNLEEANELILAMVHSFANTMKSSKEIFSEVISDAVHESNKKYIVFLVNIMIKSLHSKTRLLEMGTILLHVLWQNMSTALLPQFDYLIMGIQIALGKSKDAIEHNNEMSLSLSYQTLACLTIMGQHVSMTSSMVRPLRDSLETMLDLLKFNAEKGTEENFKEVVELLSILLKNRKFAGKNWHKVLKTCETLYLSNVYQEFARIRTLVIYGNFVGLRRSYFATPKLFNSLLQNVINVICQEPKIKDDEGGVELQEHSPTLTSVAADLLQFISEKFSYEKLGASLVSIMSTNVKFRLVMSEWQFRGVLISLGRVVKTCGNYLNVNVNSSELILVFKYGFTHSSKNVRLAATYALEKFFIFFFEESSHWTKLVFSAFLMNLTSLVHFLKFGYAQNPLQVERTFATLGTFTDMLKSELAFYLPTLMNIYLDILENVAENRIIILTIKMLGKTIENIGVEFLKHFSSLIKKLAPYLTCWDNSNFDEIRPKIIELLRKIAVCAFLNKTKIDIKDIIELTFNILKIQHARTQIFGAGMDFLLKYSPLRCRIFNFFREIPNLVNESAEDKYMPIIFSTLLGTITAIQYIDEHELNQFIIYDQRPELVSTMDNLYSDRMDTTFTVSDNNELEIARFRMAEESHTLHNEIYEALIVLKDLICPCTINRYAEEIFTNFGPTFSYACSDIRKQMLYTVNMMLHSFLKDFPFQHSSFLDLCIVEIVGMIDMETDFTIIGECVGSFLYYISIKEKYIKPRIDVHIYLLGMAKDIFQVVKRLPQNDWNRVQKEFLLSQMISYMKELADMCPRTRFCNYFRLYLIIFDAKINMPIFRSPKSDQLRHQAYAQLIAGFRLVKNFKLDCFYKIASLLMHGLSDPVVKTRGCAADGLCLIIIQCCPNEIALHKWILSVLWRQTRRERSMTALENIWYNIVTIITANIWRLPIERLSLRTIRLLPLRDEFEYNRTMLTFFETICIQRPECTLKVTTEIYKYLIEILKKNHETDIDPLYRRALTLASRLYTAHSDELRNISMSHYTMQAILTFCKLFQRSILQ